MIFIQVKSTKPSKTYLDRTQTAIRANPERLSASNSVLFFSL